MRFDVITLFPELFAPFLVSGVTRRAYESGLVEVKLWNPRDFAEGNYRRVDDRPFGGGPGMVMLAEPLALCLERIRADRLAASPGGAVSVPTVLFSPTGGALNHAAVEAWSASAGAVLICGRYEGIDQRFINAFVDHEISLGDFVLSGGEIAAMVLLDAVVRLQPGVLNDEGSHQFDSFNPALDGLLDCPHYTRPERWRGQTVPDILLSGNHAHIERWRRDQRLALTQRVRPELVTKARAQGLLGAGDEAFLTDLVENPDQDA
ncbi:MAG: tRNA (guanosine(37)-N1)-methyltransferase TrmD [Polaromonas sp. 39-63-203]|jgi:tRNA (guanine37-N1)-methyltransferase|uniref:tRNA (guanosine(37)-N1)-methyltransferase TrmD n=1 Tax=Polaromonas sp. TaxID=1869339 RepID=UPI000BD7F567|nr:tRNA (guanosine(37)-N1)-methyltransferase TrmD [Polaromonas sp.]OYY52288.1 MAG: tRNA (guanosine(37)-N1)-methyltransferase TrmD [Polaromonas sp. 35-63-240]OYY96205.1 MAG: tRNA (guanosine(37)-N1)-methyltransferase TrmD [Polaromonas sp. 28-63-22]OYZ83565.1 MAG: tRNA (guanosine(37)-N1)-methyltransferase TrmD [Polaromonas sp. 24-62-144]OZA98358.1 MAG: tRNA (guanosine(37)-N1)-methyltransferase TrmD [Polaromonas sp. 39-63-203]HQS31461.1 tRNA (guanosine(37)-N1)-methyltransferase TrmD [Polaromonas s